MKILIGIIIYLGIGIFVGYLAYREETIDDRKSIVLNIVIMLGVLIWPIWLIMAVIDTINELKNEIQEEA